MNTVESLYEDTPEMWTPFVRTLYIIPAIWRRVQEMRMSPLIRTLEASCSKGIHNREAPLYMCTCMCNSTFSSTFELGSSLRVLLKLSYNQQSFI